MTPPRSIDSAEALYRKLERTFDRRTTYGEDLAGITKNVVLGGEGADIILTPAVAITDKDGNSWQAIDLFHNVLRSWQRELGLPE